jgi:hypothetical protein
VTSQNIEECPIFREELTSIKEEPITRNLLGPFPPHAKRVTLAQMQAKAYRQTIHNVPHDMESARYSERYEHPQQTYLGSQFVLIAEEDNATCKT